MKKLVFLLGVLLLPLVLAPAANAAGSINVEVNGRLLIMDAEPLIENGSTLVPVRAITESLGAYVEWYPDTRRVEIELDERRIALTIDNNIAYANGVPKQLDVPARIVNGHTLVPARFISESLHAEVGWDENTRTVRILTYENAAPHSAELSAMEAAVLQNINQRRAALSRQPLLSVDELNQMARSLAVEICGGGNTLTHDSPRFGHTTERAAARGLRVSYEYLAFGLPDAAAIADALLRSEQGGRLLSAEARFFGLGLYKTSGSGNADIVAVAELTEGDGFILGSRQRRVTAPELALTGYGAEGAPLTVYQLDDEGNYLSRQSYAISVDGAGRFNTVITLTQGGRFAAVLGEDRVILNYL